MEPIEVGLDGHTSHPAARSVRRGFTLLEMLVVMGIITILIGAIGFAFRSRGAATVGLQSGQSIVVALLTQARSQAVLTGRDAALLVNNNPANPARYRRYLCVVIRDAANNWQPLDAGVVLPPGVYIVPRTALTAAETDGGDWSLADSTALQLTESALAIERSATNTEAWIGIGFTARGTTTSGDGPITGNIILATGRAQQPGSPAPFVYTNSIGVRGVAVTAYGLTRMLNDASDLGT